MPVALAERFRERLPLTDSTPIVSLGEGSTPLLAAPRLSKAVGAEIWLKLESLQPIGSFKLRGAANAILSAPRAELAQGVVTTSTGNMAQGVAWMARSLGVPATIVVPYNASLT